MKIPNWLKLQEEIDYYHFLLGQMLSEEKLKTPLETLIDKSTGFNRSKLSKAKKIISKLKKLKKRYYELLVK